MDNASGLKPQTCPKCGNIASICGGAGAVGYSVQCNGPLCNLTGPTCDRPDFAVKSWNLLRYVGFTPTATPVTLRAWRETSEFRAPRTNEWFIEEDGMQVLVALCDWPDIPERRRRIVVEVTGEKSPAIVQIEFSMRAVRARLQKLDDAVREIERLVAGR